MFKLIIAPVIYFSLILSVSAEEKEYDVEKILKKADRYRLPSESSQIDTYINFYENGVLKKSKDYTVYIKPGRKSLVIFKSPRERGKKVLMLQDRFWLLLKNSRRPVRITPMQKLIGEASTGDIAIMTWYEYYSGTVEKEGEVKEGKKTIKLKLRSKVKGTSYHKIDLWVKEKSFEPVAANLYMKSGKLAKKSTYVLNGRGKDKYINRMILVDNIQSGKRTEVIVRKLFSKDLDDKYFNPMFMIKDRQLD